MRDELIVELRQISKSFDAVRALIDLDWDIRAGEIHALIGENGAGKSTLIKILSGTLEPSEGQVFIDGELVRLREPRDSVSRGVRTIYQEFDMPLDLAVDRAVFLGEESKYSRFGLIDWEAMRKDVVQVLSEVGLHVDPSKRVGDLDIASRQLLAIGHALAKKCKVILMDEPTSALGSAEITHLHNKIKDLSAAGIAIVYVTHFIGDIFGLAHRVTVLRDGMKVGTKNVSEVTQAELVRMMLGKSHASIDQRSKPGEDAPLLKLRSLNIPGKLDNACLDVRCGEILGIYGGKGCGKSELCDAIYSGNTKEPFDLFVSGRKTVIKNPSHALKTGIAYLPADRVREGCITSLSVLQNISLSVVSDHSRFGVCLWGKLRETAASFVKLLGIRLSSLEEPVLNLSGGNQQKVSLARCLATKASILILNEPTSGIDVGAKREIANLVLTAAKEGKAIIIASSDLEELMPISNRILVLRQGRIVFSQDEVDFDREAILTKATAS